MRLFAASAGLVQSMFMHAPFLCILTDSAYSILKIENKSTIYKLLMCSVIGWIFEKLLKNLYKIEFIMAVCVQSMAF